MWKFIFLIAAIWIVWKLFANDFRKRKTVAEKEAKEEQDRRVAAGEMVRDPECGVYVAIDDSISVKDGQKIYYFCSYECRDKFLKKLETGGRVLPKYDESDS